MRLYFMLRYAAGYQEEVLERVFQLWQELRVLLAQHGYPISSNFQDNFWLCLNLNSVSWVVQPFSYEEIDLGFSHVAATTQKTAGHSSRGVTRRGKWGAIPRRWVTIWGANQCRGAQWLRGAEKSQQCHNHKYFNIEHMLPKDLTFLPRVPSNLITPLHGTRNNKINESQS